MKLLTLNTHSLVEENYVCKLEIFTEAIADIKPDIIALQEVNQSINAAEIPHGELKNFTSCGTLPVKADNHAYNTVKRLSGKGIDYYWAWLGIKEGYGRFEEGIAVLSKTPVTGTEAVKISAIDDFRNWKTRKVTGICTEKYPSDFFYSVHTGWWNDREEPFALQWERLYTHTAGKGRVWLMGDFNSPAEVRGEGYDMIKSQGFHDSFALARSKDSGITVEGIIDGWRDRISDTRGMRIDQIWCSKRADILRSEVIFNGVNRPVISDHYGVIIEVKD